MTTHDTPAGGQMDATETMLHERFESSVAGLHLDVPGLVEGGLLAGQRARRRHRIRQGVAGLAGVAVLAVVGVVGVRGGLLDTNATPPAGHGRVTELVPSTARALAAAAIADLPSGTRVVKAGGVIALHKAVEADLTVTVGSQPVRLDVAALAPHLMPTSCRAYGSALASCHAQTLANGDRLITAVLGSGPGTNVSGRLLALVGPQATILVLETPAAGSPSAALPLSGAQLRVIATDPLVGLETSAAMIRAGNALEHFSGSSQIIGTGAGELSHSSGSGSSGQVSSTSPAPMRQRPIRTISPTTHP